MAGMRILLAFLLFTSAAAQYAQYTYPGTTTGTNDAQVQNAVSSIMQMLTGGQTGTLTGTQPVASPETFGPAPAPTQTQTDTQATLMDINSLLSSVGLTSGTSATTPSPMTVNSLANTAQTSTGTNSVTQSTGNTIMDRVAAIMSSMPSDFTTGASGSFGTSSFGTAPTTTTSPGSVMTLSNGMQLPTDTSMMNMNMNMGQLPPNLMATLPSSLTAGLSGMPSGTDLSGGAGGMQPTPPMDPNAGGLGMPTPLNPTSFMNNPLIQPLRNQAMLTMGRTLSQRTGVHEYYRVHGCEDPTQLFTGQERVMAHYAMAQGCQSVIADQVCRLAQFRKRVGASVVTSQILPFNMMNRLESCLSPKVLFNGVNGMSMGGLGGGMNLGGLGGGLNPEGGMNLGGLGGGMNLGGLGGGLNPEGGMNLGGLGGGMNLGGLGGGLGGGLDMGGMGGTGGLGGLGPVPMSSNGTPSIQQCWMLLATVMDGGSIDPESMINTRRSLLPWRCQEASMGFSAIPYRVCCPGKVANPTITEAVAVQRMINA